MYLRQQTVPGGDAGCSGCGARIDGNVPHLALDLDNADGSLLDRDYGIAHFCNQHCVSLMIGLAEAVVGPQPAMTDGRRGEPVA